MIESIDSLKITKENNRQAELNNIKMDILIEVNIGGEISKSGVPYEKVKELIYEISSMRNINIKGLKAIPPINASESLYEKMYKLFVDIGNEKIDNVNMEYLSMGMSNDYPLAIKHGANIIRIGTGLFGIRN